MLWKLLRPQREEMYKGGNQYELDLAHMGKPVVSSHLEDQDMIGRQH